MATYGLPISSSLIKHSPSLSGRMSRSAIPSFFFFSSRRRHTRSLRDWSSDGALPIWGAHHQGLFDHMAVAVLTKGEDGQLQVERHDTPTKHLAWGGAAIGAALLVVCPP